MSTDSLHGLYRSYVADLGGALDADDDTAFRAAFERLRNALNVDLNPELRRLTASAQGALQRFRDNTRVSTLAAHEVPSARKRLQHVVKLTDEAAHGTLDLVERCLPLVQATARDASRLLTELDNVAADDPAALPRWTGDARHFLERVLVGADRKRELLSQMLITQGYQDLTGQILRGVIELVGELEGVLSALVSLANGEDTRRMPALKIADAVDADAIDVADALRRGTGPQVPGVPDADAVSGQDGVDALLADMGGL